MNVVELIGIAKEAPGHSLGSSPRSSRYWADANRTDCLHSSYFYPFVYVAVAPAFLLVHAHTALTSGAKKHCATRSLLVSTLGPSVLGSHDSSVTNCYGWSCTGPAIHLPSHKKKRYVLPQLAVRIYVSLDQAKKKLLTLIC